MSDDTCIYGGVVYSEGAEVCQAGTIRRCSGGTWIDTERDCKGCQGFHPNSQPNFNEFRPITESEIGEFANYELARPSEVNATVLTRFAELWSIRQGWRFLYFRAGLTPGDACSGEMQQYKVPLLDIISIGSPQQCSPNFSTYYKEIQFRVGIANDQVDRPK